MRKYVARQLSRRASVTVQLDCPLIEDLTEEKGGSGMSGGRTAGRLLGPSGLGNKKDQLIKKKLKNEEQPTGIVDTSSDVASESVDIDDLLDSDESDSDSEEDVRKGMTTSSPNMMMLQDGNCTGSTQDTTTASSSPTSETSYSGPVSKSELFEPDYADIDYEANDIGESVGRHLIWANGCTYSCGSCRQFATNDQAGLRNADSFLY